MLASTPPKIGHLSPALPYDELLERLLGIASFTPLANATGGPAITVPWSLTNGGVPVGVQLFATHGDERTLLELAYKIEAAHPWPMIPSRAVQGTSAAEDERAGEGSNTTFPSRFWPPDASRSPWYRLNLMSDSKYARSWTLAGLAALTVLGMPVTNANACDPDPCDTSDRFRSFYVTHDTVATDGVLVFEGLRGNGGGLSDTEAAEHVALGVRDEGGVALTGALEAADGLYIWRPDVPFAANGGLAVEIEIDNASIDDLEFCTVQTDNPMLGVAAESLPDLALPGIDLETSYEFRPDHDYPSLVCCDGAYPSDSKDSCGGSAPSWDGTGYCAFQEGVGFARATVLIEELAPEVAAALRFELVADGEVIASRHGSRTRSDFGLALDRAYALEVRAISLIDGTEIASDPYTIDGDEGTLGLHTRDVQADLDANCEMPAYVCEVASVEGGPLQGWDPESCEPYVPDEGESETDGETEGEPDSGAETEGASESDSDTEGGESGSGAADGDNGGCGCQADNRETGVGWMALLGLGLLWRRRRASRSARPIGRALQG